MEIRLTPRQSVAKNGKHLGKRFVSRDLEKALPEAKEQAVAESAEGLLSIFLATIGLQDLILGTITVYCARLIYGPSALVLFPSTGIEIADIALLASVAALIGKIVTLGVALIMAILNVIVKTSGWLAYEKELRNAMTKYCKVTKRATPTPTDNILELAPSYLAIDTPKLADAIQRIRTEAIFSYGAGFLAIAYAIYFRRNGARGIATAMEVCTISFLLLGVIQQLNYIKSTTAALRAYRPMSAKLPIEPITENNP
jgi:hypothetical protein